MSSFFAHSANSAGKRHDLLKHLFDVADRARAFAAKFGAGEFGYWAGLWHDLGKFTQKFQDYLDEKVPKGPDHSTAGAIHAFPVFDELARLVAGHHSGLPDKTNLQKRVKDAAKKALAEEALDKARAMLPSLTPEGDLGDRLPSFLCGAPRPGSDEEKRLMRASELFFRMVFSALTDADFLDTEKHFNAAQHARRSDLPTLQDLWARFEADQNNLSGKTPDRLQEVRHEIYQRCLEVGAEAKPGIFSLTVPTGGGKTRSGLAFALRHALSQAADTGRPAFDRVIVAIPYTSIIEQTADVYREIFAGLEHAVLEHHSAIGARVTKEGQDEDEDKDPVSFDEQWTRLASENWDAPLIVTTTVQLFESLFNNRPAKCRKLHNIARSVLILDEVQTLPVHLLTPTLDVLQQLTDNYGVTVVLCTATQPALRSHASFRGLRDVREIIPNPISYFTELKRVDYDVCLDEPWSWERVAEEVRNAEQCLVVVNTKKDAFALLDHLKGVPGVLHLSTQMCGVHRLETLKEVKRRLRPDVQEPCRLVSTQVVEAGVDLDFPLVLRAVGPLDRIVQAAGRCNREGKLLKDGQPVRGRVVVFQPAEGGLPPGIYQTAVDEAVSMLHQRRDLHEPKTFEDYFRTLFATVGEEVLDKKRIQYDREGSRYPAVAEKYRLIEDDGVPVVVRPKWGKHAGTVDGLLAAIASAGELPQWAFRKLQPYLVSVRRRALAKCESEGLARQVPRVAGVWEWMGAYDRTRGLVEGPLPPEELVVASD
jgi:CRISPR-associated endonuclease/helicase Cas3